MEQPRHACRGKGTRSRSRAELQAMHHSEAGLRGRTSESGKPVSPRETIHRGGATAKPRTSGRTGESGGPYSLGMLYAQQDQIPKAERELERALTLRPEYPDALNNFGVLLVREQQYSAAEEKFRFCIQSNPNFDQAYLNLARLYVLLNRKDKAREVLEQLLRQQPEHQMAQQALEMLQ